MSEMCNKRCKKNMVTITKTVTVTVFGAVFLCGLFVLWVNLWVAKLVFD